MKLSLEQALVIAQGAVSERKRCSMASLRATVLDPGGHVLAVLRDERASISRPEIATAKAAGCLGRAAP